MKRRTRILLISVAFVVVLGGLALGILFIFWTPRSCNMMPDKFLSLDWHPNGQLIAANGTSGMFLYSDTLENITPKAGWGNTATSLYLGWSLNGKFLAGDAGDNTIQIWDARTLKVVGKLTASGDPSGLSFLAWSPDGTQIAAYSGRLISIWSASTFGLLTHLGGHANFVNAASWSPDGMLLASSGLDGMIYIWNVVTEQKTSSISSPAGPGTVLLVKWSPADQRYIATGATDGVVRVWNTNTGGLYRRLDSGSSPFAVRSLAWSHDGKRIALTSDRLQIWDVESGQRLFQLEGHVGITEAVAWSPDDRRLVSAGNDGTIKIWDTSAGMLLHTQQTPGKGIRFCAY